MRTIKKKKLKKRREEKNGKPKNEKRVLNEWQMTKYHSHAYVTKQSTFVYICTASFKLNINKMQIFSHQTWFIVVENIFMSVWSMVFINLHQHFSSFKCCVVSFFVCSHLALSTIFFQWVYFVFLLSFERNTSFTFWKSKIEMLSPYTKTANKTIYKWYNVNTCM